MNKIIIDGYLTNDMEVIALKDTLIGNFTIANNKKIGEKEKTVFVRCSIFGEKRVDAMEKYLLKGARVLISGELDIRTVEENGEYKNYTNIIVDELNIIKFVNIEEEKENKKDNKKDSKRGRR